MVIVNCQVILKAFAFTRIAKIPRNIVIIITQLCFAWEIYVLLFIYLFIIMFLACFCTQIVGKQRVPTTSKFTASYCWC